MVQAQLNGFLPPEFSGSIPTFDVRKPSPRARYEVPPTTIRDARALQANARSEAEFFAEHGFVLLDHKTAVRDWDHDVEAVYQPEIDALICERLFPGRRIEVQQSPAGLLRRGRDTNNPQYAGGVHSDGPVTAELYAANVLAFASPQAEVWWRTNYERKDVAGFVSVDLWRPTNMRGPLRHMPLAVCAPNSLDPADIVPMTMIVIAPGDQTSHHLGLRFNPRQQWFFYRDMTIDEVLAFKLCEFSKDDPARH